MKHYGFTLIETLIALSIMSAITLGFFKYQQSLIKEKQIQSFEYDYSKIIKGFERKLLLDHLENKKYWTNTSFSNHYQNHLFVNLIDKKDKCDNTLNYINLNDNTYINCLDIVNFKVFNVTYNGNIYFDKNNNFKYYEIKFRNRNKNSQSELKSLQRSLKNIFNKVDLYSNIYFYNNELKQDVSYFQCLKNANSCSLRLTFGTRPNYQKEPIKKEITSDNNKNSFISHKQTIFSFDTQETKNNSDNKTKDSEISKSSISNIKNEFKNLGIDVNDKEAELMQEQIKKLNNNPKLMEQINNQLNLYCSQYDKDDYYFMSLYDKNNPCYLHYKKDH